MRERGGACAKTSGSKIETDKTKPNQTKPKKHHTFVTAGNVAVVFDPDVYNGRASPAVVTPLLIAGDATPRQRSRGPAQHRSQASLLCGSRLSGVVLRSFSFPNLAVIASTNVAATAAADMTHTAAASVYTRQIASVALGLAAGAVASASGGGGGGGGLASVQRFVSVVSKDVSRRCRRIGRRPSLNPGFQSRWQVGFTFRGAGRLGNK